MLPAEYNKNLLNFHNKIMRLPTSELKYSLYLLLLSLNNQNTEYTRAVLESAMKFTDALYYFLKKSREQEKILSLYFLNNRLENLIKVAGTNTTSIAVKQSVLNIGGSIASIGIGIIGAIIGGFCGLAKGLWNKELPFKYSLVGLVAGFCAGAAIGFRGPKRLCKDPEFRKVKFAMDKLNDASNRVETYEMQREEFETKAYEKLLECFEGNVIRLDAFLNEDKFEYEIATFGAEFISPKLRGSIGHHVFIRIPINGKFLGIEFATSPSEIEKIPIQVERRLVSGRKILEMIAFHLAILNTHSPNVKYIVTKLKSGETDCFSYINTILTATNQQPTSLSRFHKSDNLVGHVLGFFIKNLSAFPDKLQINDCSMSLK